MDLGWILGGSCVDLVWILGGSWVDLGWILGGSWWILMDLGGSWVDLVSHFQVETDSKKSFDLKWILMDLG